MIDVRITATAPFQCCSQNWIEVTARILECCKYTYQTHKQSEKSGETRRRDTKMMEKSTNCNEVNIENIPWASLLRANIIELSAIWLLKIDFHRKFNWLVQHTDCKRLRMITMMATRTGDEKSEFMRAHDERTVEKKNRNFINISVYVVGLYWHFAYPQRQGKFQWTNQWLLHTAFPTQLSSATPFDRAMLQILQWMLPNKR